MFVCVMYVHLLKARSTQIALTLNSRSKALLDSKLKDHSVRVHSPPERESILEVALHQRFLFNGRHQGLVDGLLISNSLLGGRVLGRFVFGLHDVSVLLWLDALEVGVIKLGDIDGADVNGGTGGNDVRLIDAAKRDAIDREGAGDKQHSGLELLEEDHATSLQTTSEEDKHGTRLDGGAQFRGLVHVSAAGNGLLDVVRGVPLGAFIDDDGSLATVFLAANLLGDGLKHGLGGLKGGTRRG